MSRTLNVNVAPAINAGGGVNSGSDNAIIGALVGSTYNTPTSVDGSGNQLNFVRNNVLAQVIGGSYSKATWIQSGLTGTVLYQIRNYDQSLTYPTITSTDSITTKPQIVYLVAAQLGIILPGRTKMQVRVSNNAGATWSSWLTFKTRDTRYQSPDAIQRLSTDEDTTATTKTNRTINVTNTARASSVKTNAGYTITQTGYDYIGTSNIAKTTSGDTVTTDTF